MESLKVNIFDKAYQFKVATEEERILLEKACSSLSEQYDLKKDNAYSGKDLYAISAMFALISLLKKNQALELELIDLKDAVNMLKMSVNNSASTDFSPVEC